MRLIAVGRTPTGVHFSQQPGRPDEPFPGPQVCLSPSSLEGALAVVASMYGTRTYGTSETMLVTATRPAGQIAGVLGAGVEHKSASTVHTDNV